MLGDEEISRGWMVLQPTVIGCRSFVGNSAYIADGTNLPDGVLIGVQSKIPEHDVLKSGETWFGSPALRLPARESELLTLSSLVDSLQIRLLHAFKMLMPSL